MDGPSAMSFSGRDSIRFFKQERASARIDSGQRFGEKRNGRDSNIHPMGVNSSEVPVVIFYGTLLGSFQGVYTPGQPR